MTQLKHTPTLYELKQKPAHGFLLHSNRDNFAAALFNDKSTRDSHQALTAHSVYNDLSNCNKHTKARKESNMMWQNAVETRKAKAVQ